MRGKVLVVDDEPIVNEVVERYLARDDYQVKVATAGEVALRMAQQRKLDLIVLDLMLPVIDGLDVCHKLRKDAETPYHHARRTMKGDCNLWSSDC